MPAIKTSVRDPDCTIKLREYLLKNFPDVYRYNPNLTITPMYMKEWIPQAPKAKRDEIIAICDDGPHWSKNPDGTWNSETWVDYNEEFIYWTFLDWRGWITEAVYC
jgi:hypothetical protein